MPMAAILAASPKVMCASLTVGVFSMSTAKRDRSPLRGGFVQTPVRRGEYIPGLGVSPQRNHRRVLLQQEDIADTILFTKVHQFLLQAKACGVVDYAELEERDHIAPRQLQTIILWQGQKIREEVL